MSVSIGIPEVFNDLIAARIRKQYDVRIVGMLRVRIWRDCRLCNQTGFLHYERRTVVCPCAELTIQ